MELAIDGHVLSENAVRWLLQYGWMVMHLPEKEYKLFEIIAKYNMTEEEANFLWEVCNGITGEHIPSKRIQRGRRKQSDNQST